MADFKTTNIYGDIYVNNKVGINTNVPATRLQIGQLSPTASTEGLQFGDDTSARLYRGGSGQVAASGGIFSTTYITAGTYLQTNNNNIYPSGPTSTLVLNAGNSAGNGWISGLTLAQNGNVTVYNTLTSNGALIAGSGLTRPASLANLNNCAARIGGNDVFLNIASLDSTYSYPVAIQSGRNSDNANFPLLLNPNGGNITVGQYTGLGYTFGVAGTGYFSSSLTVGGSITGSAFSGAGTGLTGTAANLSVGGNAATATTASYANALNAGNNYTVTSLTATSEVGTRSTNIGANIERGNSALSTLRFDSDAFRLYAGGTGGAGEVFYITEGGRVGIGTSPTAKLVVMDDDVQNYSKTSLPLAIFASSDPTVLIGSTDNLVGENVTLRLGTVNDVYYTYSAYIRAIQGAGVNYYKLAFGTSNGAAADTRMTIDHTGNVGIGTTVPSSPLHVYSSDSRYLTFSSTGQLTLQRNVLSTNAATPQLTIINTQGSDAGTGRGVGIQLDLGYGGTATAVGTAARGARIAALNETNYDATAANQNASLVFFTSTTGSLSEKLRIRSDGSISPITVSSTTAGATLIKADGTNGTLFSVVDDLSDSLLSVNNGAGLPVFEVFADDRIVAGQYGQNDFVIVNNKVGIGTNNPIAELHVTGSSSIPSALFLGGNVGIGNSSPSYKLDVGASGNDVVNVRLTPGYERVRYNYFDLLGYNDGNLWMIGNNNTNTILLSKNWDWDNQVGFAYTPGTIGNAAGVLQIGQISKNSSNYTHGITRLYTNGLERLTIIANGNVGITTSIPKAGLHVYNNNQFIEGTVSGSAVINSGMFALQIGPLRDRTVATNSYYPGIAFNHLLTYQSGTTYVNSPQAWIGTRLQDTTGSERDYLVFATKSGTLTTDIPVERMCIDYNGNVGIGITSPTTLLHVNGLISGSSFSGAGTGLTGTAAGLSIGGNAATVTTNANLTGDVTSTGNATSIASNAVTSVKIADSNVTLAKIANISTGTILGNNGAGAAAPLALTSAQVASMLSGQTMNIAGSSTSCSGNAATVTNGVYTTGNQSIAGNKTFTGTSTITGSIESVAVRETFASVTTATTISIDLSTATVFNLTFTGTISQFNITNVNTSKVNSFTLISAPGAGAATIAWNFSTNGNPAASIRWAGTAPTATTTSGRFDVFSFVYNGSAWYGFTGGLNYV